MHAKKLQTAILVCCGKPQQKINEKEVKKN